jgi:hypothetical protein
MLLHSFLVTKWYNLDMKQKPNYFRESEPTGCRQHLVVDPVVVSSFYIFMKNEKSRTRMFQQLRRQPFSDKNTVH